MVATLLSVWQLLAAPMTPGAFDSTASPHLRADSAAPAPRFSADSAAPAPRFSADSAAATPRIVRVLPAVEVHALLSDMRSGQTTHLIPARVLRSYPIDGLADVLALQAGVVAQAEELHVRGGRAGETMVTVDGLGLNEPSQYRPMELPLLALESAELASGALEAPLGGALAGVLQFRTANPTARPSAEWRWESDGRRGTNYDRYQGRVSTPLHVMGLGAVAAGDGTFDDTWLPALRSRTRHDFAGLPLGWRAENRVLGSLKIAPVERPEKFSAEVFANRQVHRPYSPSWSLDGWTVIPFNPKMSPVFTPYYVDSAYRYRAADHLDITDDRQVAALVKTGASRGLARGTLSLGWLRTRTVRSLDGQRHPLSEMHRPKYGNGNDRDGFHVLFGDDPLYRESASDRITLRADGETLTRAGTRIMAGAGLYEDWVSLHEVNWLSFGRYGVDLFGPPPLDSVRTYDVRAPGGFAYVQGRWQSGGLILNAGLRAECFSPGWAAAHQTLPGTSSARWSLGPRLSLAYPISVRDVFSFSYVRMQQPPARDFLYDDRLAVGNRLPLGNPALESATAISYEGAVKHVFGPEWALQTSIFFRDVFGQVGLRDFSTPAGPIDLRYVSEDQSSTLGFEWSLLHAAGEHLRLEARYTWMQAWGNESRPGGDPYGPVRVAHTPAFGDAALSWDRRHSFLMSGAWSHRRGWAVAWTTAVGSPLPWTPKPLRQAFTDFSLIDSRRLSWTENTNLSLSWAPAIARGLKFGVEARNLFDNRSDRLATLDGYPNPIINTQYDDYGAYRTLTGLGGGAYWNTLPEGDPGHWVAVHDPRLITPPRAFRASIGGSW